MTFTIIDAEQRSPEWFAARVGRVTGSGAKHVVAKIKSGEAAAARRDYRTQLVCERLINRCNMDDFTNADIERGIALEPVAFAAYEAQTGHMVRRTGFLSCTDLMVGCSLDGDVDNFTGIVEFKAPRPARHLMYLRDGGIPKEHFAQIQHNLWVSGAQWADFVSFSDAFPADLQLSVARILREDADLAGYEAEVMKFLNEVDLEYGALRGWKQLEAVHAAKS